MRTALRFGLGWLVACTIAVLGAAAAADDPEIDLSSAASVSGVVFDRSTKVPVDSFAVTVYASNRQQARTETFNDSAGRFAMDLARRAAAIEVRASGYVPWTRYVPWTSAPRSQDQESPFVKVALRRGRVLAGHVVAAVGGRPIAGATVEAAGYLKGGVAVGGTSASTDAKGRFELRVPRGECRLKVSAPGHGPRTVHVRDSRRHSLEIRLANGKEIAGELVLPDGTLATGRVTLASVRPRGQPPDFWEIRELLCGRQEPTVQTDGKFRFADLPVGRYRLHARSPHGAVADRTIEIAENTASLPVRLIVQPLAKVVGSVAGLADGEHATLSVEEKREDDAHSTKVVNVIEDVANGRFDIAGIPNGEFLLSAWSTAGREVFAAFEIADLRDAEVDVAFLWSSRLTGRVLIDGQGAGGVDVFATYAGTHAGAPLRTLRDYTARDGTYDLRGLADGNYEVAVKGNRFNVAVEGHTEVDLPLAQTSLSGVVRVLGLPLGGRIVVARPVNAIGREAEPLVLHTLAGPRGKYRFEGLPKGRYTIVVMDPLFKGAVREAYVDGAVTKFNFHLWPTRAYRPVRVASNAGAAGQTLGVAIRGGAFDHLSLDVPLNAKGAGRLPRSLQGADLHFSLNGAMPAVVPNWDGEAIVVAVGEE